MADTLLTRAQPPDLPARSRVTHPRAAACRAAARNARAICRYPAVFGCLFGPRGGGAQSQVHWHTAATLLGIVPRCGTVTRLAKSALWKAPATSAIRAPADAYTLASVPS